ncbi:hypothetical protein ES705_09565 [subsurface metagenome]
MADSIIGQFIVGLLPILVFVALYLGFYIWGRRKNKKKKEVYVNDIITAMDPYIENYTRKDPTDRQIELRTQLSEDYIVKSASAWILLLPRTSFPTMLVDGLFFRNKDSFGLAANFSEKPRVIFEVIPYRSKSAIRKDFDYLVAIDDIDTTEQEINSTYLIKSNKPKVINQLIRSKTFIKTMKDYPKIIQWISIRTDEPHFEMKFELTGNPADLLALTKFTMILLKFFGKVVENTKSLPIPVILKKETKKLSDKEKAKKEKEKEKFMKEREKRREKARSKEEKQAKKRAKAEDKARRKAK